MAKRGPKLPIQRLDRGLILLEAVRQPSRPVPLVEWTTVRKIGPSSMYRRANAYHRSTSVRELAREHLVAPAVQVRGTSPLAIRIGRQAPCVHDELTHKPVVVALRPGRGKPPHGTAMGKALLADFELATVRRHNSLPGCVLWRFAKVVSDRQHHIYWGPVMTRRVSGHPARRGFAGQATHHRNDENVCHRLPMAVIAHSPRHSEAKARKILSIAW